jgi:hypothetical protein
MDRVVANFTLIVLFAYFTLCSELNSFWSLLFTQLYFYVPQLDVGGPGETAYACINDN